MMYGHAERILDAIRLLEGETVALLHSLPQLDAEKAGWLTEASGWCDLLGDDMPADVNQVGGHFDGAP